MIAIYTISEAYKLFILLVEMEGNMYESFITVEEVADELKISKSYAYKIVRQLNKELKDMGYHTITARVSRSYFKEKYCYYEPKERT